MQQGAKTTERFFHPYRFAARESRRDDRQICKTRILTVHCRTVEIWKHSACAVYIDNPYCPCYNPRVIPDNDLSRDPLSRAAEGTAL